MRKARIPQKMTRHSERADAQLTVDLDALTRNYRLLKSRIGGARCAAVVKADAYGLGMHEVVSALIRDGCDSFFVATLDEAMALRERVPGVFVGVFNGVTDAHHKVFKSQSLIPVINTLGQLATWRAQASGSPPHAAILHVDTGMCRLGLTSGEVALLADEPDRLNGVDVVLIMSHLACADDAEQPMNNAQREAFAEARKRLPAAPASLANSSGIFLGEAYHFDLVRPGAALYGINPTPGRPNPMAEVVRLRAKIIQVRDVDRPQTVGYGAAHRVSGPSRIATIPVGYADGLLRNLGGRGRAAIGEALVPIVGRVSMDLVTLDVTKLPATAARPGVMVDLIGGPLSLDSVAESAGTIGYEILTRLGQRLQRQYVGGGR